MNSSGASNSTTTPIWIVGDLEIVMVCINLLFGLPTHTYVLWLTVTRNGVALEFFNLSLSVCEIGTCLDSLLFVIAYMCPRLLILSQLLQGLLVTGRPLFQSLICVERYLAVVHPVTFLKYKPLRYRLICCAIAWMIVLGSCLCCMLILMFSTVYIHALFFSLQFFIFLSIQLFCLVAVLRALTQSGPGERKREKEENRKKRRVLYLILVSTANMVTVYAPYTIIALLNILMHKNIPVLWFSAVMCYVLASFIQFIIYLHRAGKLSCFYSSLTRLHIAKPDFN